MKVALVVLSLLATGGCAASSSRLPQDVRCIFIDAGAHRGQSYSAFQMSGLYSRYEWEIWAIEANPYMMDSLPPAPRLTKINQAIWIEKGTLELNLISETSGANSILDPMLGRELDSVTVDSFDFSAWLKDNFAEEDVVILSIDIEGAEYEVIQKMLKDKTTRLIDRLYIEVHPWLLEGMTHKKALQEFRALLNDFRRRGISVVEDSAEDAMKTGLWTDFLLAAPTRSAN